LDSTAINTDAVIDDPVVTELIDRATQRGYVLLSEIHELHDPLNHGDEWAEELAQRARDLGAEVVDDLTVAEDEIERPEAQPLTLSTDSVRQYLNEAGRHELLTAEDEQDLAKRYQAGLAAKDMLEDEDLKFPPKQKALLTRIVIDGERAKDKMVRTNLRLVVASAKKFRGRGVDLLSLIQDGNLGLIRGVEKFDHTKGYKFSTYAVWWIRQALQRGVANRGRTIRVPVHVWELRNKIRAAEVELRQMLGREPTEIEVAEAADLSVDRVREVREAVQMIASLDKPVGEDGDATLGDLLTDPSADDPERQAAQLTAREQVNAVLQGLSERERTILLMRYGLMDGEEHTLQDIGELFDLTRERIRQIEKKTLAKLRHPSRAHQLQDLLAVFEPDGDLTPGSGIGRQPSSA
jgi:RNA polymerase sigma factor (sigma-70 family)